MKRRLSSLALTSIAAILLVVVSASQAFGYYVYLGEMPAWYNGSYNGVNHWYALTDVSMDYYADPSLSSIAVTAFGNWTSAVGFTFYTASQAAADITILPDTAMTDYGIITFTMGSFDSTRKAIYLMGGAVKINPNLKPQGGLQATLTHEIGHALGLADRYTMGSSLVCDTGSTIMNSGACSNRPSQPSADDVARMNSMYKTGDIRNLAATAPSSSTVTVTWNDFTWGEFEHEMTLQYYNGSSYQDVSTVHHLTDTGLRYGFGNSRQLSTTLSRGSSGPGGYRVCGKARFKRGTGYGPTECSNVVQLD